MKAYSGTFKTCRKRLLPRRSCKPAGLTTGHGLNVKIELSNCDRGRQCFREESVEGGSSKHRRMWCRPLGELIAALPRGLPDCMIVDLQMPDMTGLELQYHLARVGIKIPTVVITAHDEPGTRERCIAADLTKPLDKTVLFAAIDKASERSPSE
jgi:CheY-like chemotaxis protein